MSVDKASLHPDTLGKINGYQQSPVTPGTGLGTGASPVALRNRDTALSATTMGGLSTREDAAGALKLISLWEALAQAGSERGGAPDLERLRKHVQDHAIRD